MKLLTHYPFLIYVLAAIACLVIMIIIDFILGPEAEILNAWVIVNKLIRRDIGIADSLAIQHFGLFGATLLMLIANTIFGIVFVQIGNFIFRFFS